MGEKRYQVFVSSTFTDLQTERRQVQQALLQMDCIPAGMELFPATNEEQREFIKKIIDDCDYYIVLVAGRYGSTTPEGISYTELEFDYAVEREIPILGFLHRDPESIPAGQSELDATARQRLAAFREKVSTGRLVMTWSSGAELASQVILSLNKVTKSHPAPGWVRGPATDTAELLRQLNEVRRKNEDLEAQLRSQPKIQPPSIPNIAGSNEQFRLSGSYKSSLQSQHYPWTTDLSWDEMLYHIGPELLALRHDDSVNHTLATAILLTDGKTVYEASIDGELFKTLRIQFMALGFADVQSHNTPVGRALFWVLTNAGRARLMQLRTVKSAEPA